MRGSRRDPSLSEYDTFDASGILSAIRHPWYTASILFIWAGDISLSTLLINIIISAYFVIGTILEERKLLLQFGENYREYQKNVSMFIPYKWLKAKIAKRLRARMNANTSDNLSHLSWASFKGVLARRHDHLVS